MGRVEKPWDSKLIQSLYFWHSSSLNCITTHLKFILSATVSSKSMHKPVYWERPSVLEVFLTKGSHCWMGNTRSEVFNAWSNVQSIFRNTCNVGSNDQSLSIQAIFPQRKNIFLTVRLEDVFAKVGTVVTPFRCSNSPRYLKAEDAVKRQGPVTLLEVKVILCIYHCCCNKLDVFKTPSHCVQLVLRFVMTLLQQI